MTDLLTRVKSKEVTADLLLGVTIMGTTGAVIGLYLGGPFFIATATFLGAILGGFVSAFGGRRFFLSILTGVAVGGLAALLLGGPDMVVIGAGAGGAIGGFVGVNLELFMRG